MARDGVISWRAGCAERCTSGSEGGPGRRAGREPGTAPRSDPYTYCRSWEGWLYLAVVLDCHSRKVIGWSLREDLRAELVTDAIEMAVARRRPESDLVHHSDRGSQYVSLAFGERCREAGIDLSMTQGGSPLDNAVAESFFATLKREQVDRYSWPTRSDLRVAIFEWIEVFYNRQRLHSTLNYATPEEFESLSLNQLKKAA